ncbi:MAG: hypothetical protein Q9188_002329 [Gyalolechia gomerana]
MAILGNLKAFIAVADRRQKEYAFKEMENENPDLVSKYIECKTGSLFTIQVEFNRSTMFKSDAIQLEVYFDGHYADSVVVRQSKLAITGRHCSKISGAIKKIDDRWEYRPFLFSEIKQTEETSQWEPDERSRRDLGSITIKAFHAKVKGPVAEPSGSWDVERALGQSITLSERKLKGMNVTHTAKTPSPVPLDERPIESLSVEEMQQLLRQYQSRSAEPETRTKLESTIARQRIKHEQDIKQERPIKREKDEEMDEILASARVKKPKRAETIDLSDD